MAAVVAGPDPDRAAKEHAGDDRHEPKTSLVGANESVGNGDQFFRHAAIFHQLSGQHEQRYRYQGKWLERSPGRLRHQRERNVRDQDAGNGRDPGSKGNRDSDGHGENKDSPP